jgi:hypothetical protein
LRTLLPMLALAASMPAVADEDLVVREYSFPLDGIEEVELHASVGSMHIVPYDGDEIRLVLEIESKDHGWFDRKRDVSGVELESHTRGSRLVLRQTEEDTNTEWTVQLPVVARTTIDMGVGDIDAELGATELDIDLGVGEVDVTLPEASTGEVDISVGVGDAKLRGADDVDYDKAFVSQDIRGHGAGDLDARIEIGVGDATVTLD